LNTDFQRRQSLFKFMPLVRRQTQPVPAPASTSLNDIQAEPVFALPYDLTSFLPVHNLRPATLVQIPQEIKFYKKMDSLLENLKKPIRFRRVGNNWDGVSLAEATSNGEANSKGKHRGSGPQICDSEAQFDKTELPKSGKLRIDVSLHFNV
jgi:hypothetical protein